MQPVKPQWLESGAVLVCEKCYKQRIPEENPDVAAEIGHFNLRDWLKSKCKEAGFGKRVRIVGTGCLDVCGKGTVTACLIPEGTPGETETYTLHPVKEKHELLDRILKKFIPQNK